MKREDFIFTVGFDGATAVVDGAARRKYHGYDTDRLMEAGLYKQAVFAAVYDADQAALSRVLTLYNEISSVPIEQTDELIKTYGVPLQVLDTEEKQGIAIKIQII